MFEEAPFMYGNCPPYSSFVIITKDHTIVWQKVLKLLKHVLGLGQLLYLIQNKR